jgi:hypothetical protein
MKKILFLAALLATPALAEDWPAERLGALKLWDAAYDPATGERFIPAQLVIPGIWDGTRALQYPPAGFSDGGGDRWSGPGEDAETLTGRKILAYGRVRTTKREGTVKQTFAVRAEGDGIGRIRDSRFGGLECAGEIKFPLGLWRQGEVRRNEYRCSNQGRAPEARVNTITIEKIDFPCRGVPHCMQFTWVHEGNGKIYDDRRYVMAPGLGMISAERRK